MVRPSVRSSRLQYVRPALVRGIGVEPYLRSSTRHLPRISHSPLKQTCEVQDRVKELSSRCAIGRRLRNALVQQNLYDIVESGNNRLAYSVQQSTTLVRCNTSNGYSKRPCTLTAPTHNAMSPNRACEPCPSVSRYLARAESAALHRRRWWWFLSSRRWWRWRRRFPSSACGIHALHRPACGA